MEIEFYPGKMEVKILVKNGQFYNLLNFLLLQTELKKFFSFVRFQIKIFEKILKILIKN